MSFIAYIHFIKSKFAHPTQGWSIVVHLLANVDVQYYYSPSSQGWSILALLQLPIIILHPLRDGVYWFCYNYLLLLLFFFFRPTVGTFLKKLLNTITPNFLHMLHYKMCLSDTKNFNDLGSDLGPRSPEWRFAKMAISPILSKIFQFRLQILKANVWGYLSFITLIHVKLFFDQPILQNVILQIQHLYHLYKIKISEFYRNFLSTK